MKLPRIACAVILAATAASSTLLTSVSADSPHKRPFGDAKVLATFPPPPGFSEGIAFGKSSNLYVAIATPLASGVAIVNTSGTETGRLTNPVGSPVFPYDSPANIAFDGHGSLLVTNHAFATMIPSNFNVLDVYVGDKGSPLSKPDLP